VSVLLEVEGLTRHFVTRRSPFGRPLATVKAVDGVDLTVPAGSTLALVGETGCGKSTLGRLILRLFEPMSGDIRFEGRSILAFGEKELRAGAACRTARLAPAIAFTPILPSAESPPIRPSVAVLRL